MTLYGLLHYYFYVRYKGAITMSPLGHGLLLAFLLAMVVMPILIRVASNYTNPNLTSLLSYLGYLWMGALFLFFSTHILIDIYNGIVSLSSMVFSTFFLELKPNVKISFLGTLGLVAGIMIYGMFEAQRIRLEKIILSTNKLPSKINSLRIVQISDIHFSATNRVRFAKKIVKMIESLNPDILVSTGDLIERDHMEREEVAALFRSIRVTYGKYAVTGNHEFYTGIHESSDFTEKAGFKMLRNEGVAVEDVVNVVGIDDPTSKQFGIEVPIAEDLLLKRFSNKRPTILLKHQPRIYHESVPAFDLQLSGHTHKGQIFPFSLITSRFFPNHNGLIKIVNNAYLYVSSGTGTWGPPVRFLARPEITVIELKNKE